jgi:tetratricopeptide (TPR) repeat protein
VFTDISLISKALKQTVQQCKQNAMPMSFVDTSGDVSQKKLDQLDPSFMYTQIIKEIFLTIQFKQKHIEEFINYFREQLSENDRQLHNIEQFGRKYRDETPIRWYTSEDFLYPMLNRALRTMDMRIIIEMGFFINDLHRHIEQLHNEQFGSKNFANSFTVYRGQGVTKTEFEHMTKTKGGLMSFNNFLSTSKNHDVSFFFAESNAGNPNLVGILFAMTIDPAKSTTPFASITDVSNFQGENELLFSMHTVFRIGDITPIGGNLFQVDLTLTSDNDKDLRMLTDHIREETFPNSSGWYRLGEVLRKMGQSGQAEQVYEVLLEQATSEDEKIAIYHQLGRIKDEQGEYKEAIRFYEKSLEIWQQSLPPNHPSLATSYNNIGLVYSNMGEYSKALSSYEKSLAIRQQSLPPNHPDLATSYNNIGLVYDNMSEYSKALSSYEQSLVIWQESLPPNHPSLAISHNNIGLVYSKMGEYSKALLSYEKSLAIQQRSLPPNHPDLASSYNNIGLVYSKMGEYLKALSYYDKTLEIRQQLLPPKHPDLAMSYNNIGAAYHNMGEYSKALSSYEESLAIRQQSLPPNHPDLAMSYNNIAGVYYNMGEYSKAFSSYEKSLAIQQQSLPPNHPDLAKSYIAYGIMTSEMGEHSKAIAFYEKALEIQKQSLPPNHPDLCMSYNNMGLIYENMNNYSKALSSFQRAVDIGQQSLPSDHPHLRIYRDNLDRIKS